MKTLLIVSGNWNNGSNAGVRTANANNSPGNANDNISFRLCNCAPRVARDPRIAAIERAHHTQVLRSPVRAKHTKHRRQRVAPRKLKPGQLMPKTHKNLLESICDFESLYVAYRRAAKGKQGRPDVIGFTANLGEGLIALRDSMRAMRWKPGQYRLKVIHEPKERVIRIAPFSDRIVHQALCAVIAPLFEETFIHDTYACREGKGTHRAVDRLTQYLRRDDSAYILKLDLRKFFDSIPHGLVMRELEWRIGDPDVLELCRRILGSYVSDPSIFPEGFGRRGLPIGNLTSQWFANIVGARIDHHVKHELKCRHYARYMDDLVLLGGDSATVHSWSRELGHLIAEMGLVVNPKTRVFPTRAGVAFLGYVVWRDHRRVLRQNVVRGRKRIRAVMGSLRTGAIDTSEAEKRLRSWFAHLGHADTYRLRGRLADEVNTILGDQ